MISHMVYGIPSGLWSHAQPHPGIPCVPCTSAMRAQLPYLDVGLINLQGNPSVPSPSLTWPPTRKHLTQCFSRKCLVAVFGDWVPVSVSSHQSWLQMGWNLADWSSQGRWWSPLPMLGVEALQGVWVVSLGASQMYHLLTFTRLPHVHSRPSISAEETTNLSRAPQPSFAGC